RVDPATGIVDAGNLGWWQVPLRSVMEKRLGMPVHIDNDVQGALYAEWKTGICKDAENVVYISLGTGIGGAFLINGRFYRGRGHDGAEIGHMITHADGEPCACGGRGCFERYGSAAALSRMAGGANTRVVFSRAAEGDAAMTDILKRYTHELCIGIASVSVIFRPDMIVLGGGLSNAGNALLDPITEELSTASPTIPKGKPPVVKLALHGNEAGVIGAALMAMDGV
ncbi:MAG: ROK family protein, partial [Clostridia bacterium]|nr:ROK family protein [Clostridia bacterium]